MASEWKVVSLGDVAKIQGGYAFKSKDFTETGIPVVKIKNVRKRDVDLADVARVSQDIAEKASSFLIKSWDVLISMTGSGPNAPASIVGRVARHSGEDDVFLINQRVGRFLIKEKEQLDQRFLYYLFSEDKTQLELLSIATGSANQVNISGKQIESIEVNLPPLPEQKAIAHILGSLDDKIELNRQMNEALEAMAQALFKSWFVDFDPVIDNALTAGNAIPDEFLECAEQRKGIKKKDNSDIQDLFPDEFEFTEEMGWIPKGWGNGTLSDICSFGKGKINTSELSLENYVSTENMNKEKSGISHAASIASTNQVPKFSVGQTLISNIRPYFKKIWLASFSGGRSNDVLGFQANNSVANEYLFNLLYQDSFFDYMTATSKGTKMPRGDKAAIMSWQVAIPPLILMEEFSNKVNPMYLANQIRSTQEVSLSKLRDTLLPKLMSGELRIPDDIL